MYLIQMSYSIKSNVVNRHVVAHAIINEYRGPMSTKLGTSQLAAWTSLVARYAKVLSLIERDLLAHAGALPLHLYDVLFALKNAPAGKLRMGEIADEIAVSRSALSRSVDKLESLGLIAREKCEGDGRGQFAAITKQGRSAQAKTWPIYEASIQAHFGQHLTASEADALVKILRKLTPAAGRPA